MSRSSSGFGAVLALAIVATAVCVSSGPAYGAGGQVSITPLFNADDVLRYSGGNFTTPSISWDNPTGSNNDNYMVTQSAANQLAGGSNAVGINDNGFYPATGARLYDVQLGFTNATPTGTNVVIRSTTLGSFTFDVPSNYYSQFAIFGSSGSGSTNLTITLNYATGSATVLSNVTLPDWYSGNPGTTAAGAAGTHFALTPAMSREAAAGNCPIGGCYQVPNVNGSGAYIYGINLAPDSTRVLTSVSVSYAPSSPGYTVANFVAAAGAVSSTVTPAPSSVWLAVMGCLALLGYTLWFRRPAVASGPQR